MGRNCRSTSKCLKCKGRYHTSICEREVAEPNPRPPTAQPDDARTLLSPPYTPTLVHNALCSDEENAILLHTQTARSIVHNPANSKTLIEGSQKSYTCMYITERAMNRCLVESTFSPLLHVPLDPNENKRRYVQLWMLECVIHECHCHSGPLVGQLVSKISNRT